ncbi:MAG: HAD family phosphatase [Pirellulales bacterium]|nr:HAD family phosphatase [Pirellulales bacterium]
MPISFLYFDFGNVLCTFCHDRMCRQIAEVASVSVARVEEVLFDSHSQWRFEAGELDPESYYQHLCTEFGSQLDWQRLVHAACDIFEINVPVFSLIKRLAAAGNRLGILSNTNEIHWNYCADGRFAPLLPGPFQEIILSYEVRLMKPDQAMYRVAIDRAGVPAREIFFTDDRVENVSGALQAGIDAVLFQDADQLIRELRKRGVPGAS